MFFSVSYIDELLWSKQREFAFFTAYVRLTCETSYDKLFSKHVVKIYTGHVITRGWCLSALPNSHNSLKWLAASGKNHRSDFRSHFIRPIWSKTVTNWIDESILDGKYVCNDKRQFLYVTVVKRIVVSFKLNFCHWRYLITKESYTSRNKFDALCIRSEIRRSRFSFLLFHYAQRRNSVVRALQPMLFSFYPWLNHAN